MAGDGSHHPFKLIRHPLTSLEFLQIYHKVTTSAEYIFYSHITPDGIAETLKIQIFLWEDASRPTYIVYTMYMYMYSTLPRAVRSRHPLFLKTKFLESMS